MLNKKGFTLVEFLLYIVIAGVMMTAMSSFLTMALESRVKNQTIAEVEQVGSRAMNLITQNVRNAATINAPSTGNSGTMLSLEMADPNKNPTTLNISGSSLQVTEGVGSAIDLSSSRISISDLNFKNLSQADTPGIIQIQFTISHKNLSGRQEYNYSKIFTSSASLR